MRKTLFSGLLASLLFVSGAQAGGFGLSISQPYLRFVTLDVPVAGYFNLTNDNSSAIILTGARSFSCGQIMMHQSSTTGGTARMDMVSSLSLAPHQRIAFKPGGYHLMCLHPAAALQTARTAVVTLLFQGGHTIDVTFYLTNARGIERQ